MSEVVYFLVIFLAGFSPIYLFLRRHSLDQRTEVVAAVAFAPIAITVFNTINVLIGIQHSWARFIAPVLVLAVSIVQLRRLLGSGRALSLTLPLVRALTTGLIFGIAYWFVAFYFYRAQGLLYFDVIWNLGWAGEFKNHFPPSDPRWHVEGVTVYHYFTDMFIAAMANFVDLNVLEAMHLTNFFVSIATFVLLALLFERYTAQALTIVVLLLVSSHADGWNAIDILQTHVTGSRASTFFWCLPLVVGLFYFWKRMDRVRHETSHLTLACIALFAVVLIYFSKASFIIVFILLEGVSFVRFVASSRTMLFRNFAQSVSSIARFIYYPFFTGVVFFAFAAWGETMFFGIEARDFGSFESWNPLWPFLVVFLPVIVTLVINRRHFSKYRLSYLVVSVICFIGHLVFKHVGNSDLYFVATAMLLNAIFLGEVDSPWKLTSYLMAMMLCGAIFSGLAEVFKVKGLNALRIDFPQFANRPIYGELIDTPEIQEYTRLATILPTNALIALPRPVHIKDFLLSTFMERRMWNETNVYRSDLFSPNYYPIYLYFKQQPFVPDDLPDTPRADHFGKALQQFVKEIRFDTTRFREYDLRFDLYEKVAFGNLRAFQNDSTASANGWTHILVKPADTARCNSWIRSLPCYPSKFLRVYAVDRSELRNSYKP